MRRNLILLLAIVIAPTLALAQALSTDPLIGLAGLNVEKFEVTGNVTVAQETIRVYLGVEVGRPFFPDAVRTSYMNLWQTGLFDDVRIDAERGETGVILKVAVKERPRIGAVEYRGNKNLNTAKIVEALEAAKIDLNIGRTVDQIVIKRAAEVIKTTYSEGGFEGVTVDTGLEDRPNPNEKRIVFTINEGIKARVAKVEFEGNSVFSDRRLRMQMKEVKKHDLYTWARKRNLYIPSKLEADLERIRNFYLDRGYKDVQFGDAKIRTVGTKKPKVVVSIPVREGTVHTFRNVTVTGSTVFEKDVIIGNWPLKKGETLRRGPIQSRIELFEDLYRRRGYIYAYINANYNEVEENVVDVDIQVFEGDQFRLGRLEFEGNTVTKDKVLRREIFIHEGSIMDMETFKASMYKLGQLGYFKVTENPDFRVNQETKTVDITVKGKEEGKNDVQFGGGYSEAYGFFGTFQFSTRNLLGNGNVAGVSYQRGSRQNFFSLTYTDPWFMDRPHSFGVSIYDRATTLPDAVGFDSEGKGGTVSYGYRIGRFESISFSYGYEDRQEKQSIVSPPDDNGNVPLPDVFDEQFITSAIIPAYRYDSRDNPFDTFRGTRLSGAVSYVGGFLGGTISLIKPIMTFSHFHPISKRGTVSFNAEGGYIHPTSDDCANFIADLDEFDNELCVPRSERFFVGGEQSVRGFDAYSIGPREVINGFASVVGGYSYTVFNLEYIYKVNDPLRLVLFADAGQAYGYKENIDLGNLRYSTGAELRIFLPVFQFPLRFIYAYNVDPTPIDEFETFQFSIGNTF
ncbi:MAG: outer membrane protein assembly factor BamA [Thermoanaerobaculia bacterium]|nr:outer membrane protein assembly factor BamA [Thermoanaerobaculia bacterium]